MIPNTLKKHKRKGKRLNKVSFDKETVPKHLAKQVTSNEEDHTVSIGHKSQKSPKDTTNLKLVDNTLINKIESSKNEPRKIKKNKLKTRNPGVEDYSEINEVKNKKPSKKRKAVDSEVQLSETLQKDEDTKEQTDEGGTLEDKEESKRAKKRKKHAQLLDEKKTKAELTMQEKCLNYLSQWRHCRNDWKFEKLKQVWLHQNMFDSDKMPDKFWDTLILYFSSAKGKIRQVISDNALKIVEAADGKTDSSESSEIHDVKLHRARSILQNLEE